MPSAWREMEYQFVSVIRGRHVSKPFWTPTIDEVLTVIAEDGNRHDRFAVALSVPEIGVVGHVPREFSCVVRHFREH